MLPHPKNPKCAMRYALFSAPKTFTSQTEAFLGVVVWYLGENLGVVRLRKISTAVATVYLRPPQKFIFHKGIMFLAFFVTGFLSK